MIIRKDWSKVLDKVFYLEDTVKPKYHDYP